MDKVFIVAPGNTVTGGPELCHQLADALNQDSKRAFIIYAPFDGRHETPTRYRHYNTHQARCEDVEPGSIVVLPEVYGDIVGTFPGCRVYMWWLSVGNFFKVVPPVNLDAAPSANVKRQQLKDISRHAALNLYQSDYARGWLESNGLQPASRLSDQLAGTYLDALACPPQGFRHNLIVYNPTKGLPRTEQVLRALARDGGPEPDIIPMANLSPASMHKLLSHAKVYLDFGGHPGKDRIPREAAALGCCVLTNTRGSAGNAVDVPIPDEFKINDRKHGWERRAARKIRVLLNDYDRQRSRFDHYRAVIAGEPAQFRADVRAVFERVPV
jgi:hypothetical protein